LDQRVVLCGACGFELTALEYLACESKCPRCHHSFNPGCARHHHLYFVSRSSRNRAQGRDNSNS
jgi:uncharacterized CHY-type Zn-finger protein